MGRAQQGDHHQGRLHPQARRLSFRLGRSPSGKRPGRPACAWLVSYVIDGVPPPPTAVAIRTAGRCRWCRRCTSS